MVRLRGDQGPYPVAVVAESLGAMRLPSAGRTLLQLVTHPSSSLDNARSAAGTIQQAVLDRARLAPSPPGRPRTPGSLGKLTEQECRALLARHSVGRLAYVARAGVPDLVPVNYTLHNGDVLVASGPGPKLQAAERHDSVILEVDELDEGRRTGRSVVVAGRARRLDTCEVQSLLESNAPLPDPWVEGVRRHLVRISSTRIDGRELG